jgi:hypothetical protein
MASQPFHWIIPQPDAPAEDIEWLQQYQLTHAFYQEARDRALHQAQVQQYHQLAAQHQNELQRLRQDINILGWFTRWMGRSR